MDRNVTKSPTREKRDFLKTCVFPRKNADFQGLPPVRKKHEKLSKRVFFRKKMDEKSMKKTTFFNRKIDSGWRRRAKLTKNASRDAPRGHFFSHNSVFCRFWGSGWGQPGPRGPPGTSREPAQSLLIFRRFLVLSKNRARPAPGRPQGGPGTSPGTPRGPFWDDFQFIFGVNFHSPFFSDAFIFSCIFSGGFRFHTRLSL